MPLDYGQTMMPGFTRIVDLDPIPNVGYGKVEVKDAPRDWRANTEMVVVKNAPKGGTHLNVGDRFTLLTPAGPPALQVTFEYLLCESCFFEHLYKMKRGPHIWGLDKQSHYLQMLLCLE